MLSLGWFIGFGALVAVLAYHRASLWLSTLIIGCYSLAWQLSATPHLIAAIAVWSLYLSAAAILNVRPLRRALISNKLLARTRRARARLSVPELDVLASAAPGWEASLLTGRPDWKRLLALSPPRLSAAERAFVDGPTTKLCAMLDEWEIVHQRQDLPPQVWQFLKRHGFLAMGIAPEYGGPGLRPDAQARVIMRVTARSPSTGATLAAANALGPAPLLLRYGTAEQRARYLQQLAAGDEIACFALSSPIGPDGQTRNHALVCRDDSAEHEVLGLRLHWDVPLVPLAPVATLIVLAVPVADPDRLLGDQADCGMTLVLIPSMLPGVETSRRHLACANAFMTGPSRGNDVFVPLDHVVGGREMIGQGWHMLMDTLPAGQAVALPAANVAIAKHAARVAGIAVRLAGTARIARSQPPERLLARIAASAYTLEATRQLNAAALDRGEGLALAAALERYQFQPLAHRALADAATLWPGGALFQGRNNPLSPGYLSIPAAVAIDAAGLFTPSILTYGHSALSYHPFLFRELQPQADEQADAIAFDKALFGHIGFFASNLMRTLFLGLTGARLTRTAGDPALKRYYQQLSRVAATFALVGDAAAVTVGFKPRRRQRLSERLDAIAAQLYAAAAMLKLYETQNRPRSDRALLKWALQDQLYAVQEGLLQVLDNLRGPLLRRLLRRWAFPFGRPYAPPTDRRVALPARLLTTPGPGRERLLADLCCDDSATDPAVTLEHAFAAVIEAAASERKLAEAVKGGRLRVRPGADLVAAALAAGLLDVDEAERLERALNARRTVLGVDDFPVTGGPALARAAELPASGRADQENA